MKTLHLSKIYHKVEAILKRDGLWPEGEKVAAVDYSLCQEIVLTERPTAYDFIYKVDFGGSEGIYIDFSLLLFSKDAPTKEVNFGTIKTLTANRETLAAYSALAANFRYFACQEIDKALDNSFSNFEMFYEIYSMNTESTFQPFSLQVPDVIADMASYATCYRKVASGSFLLHRGPSEQTLCKYIAQKCYIEMEYAIEISDVIVLNIKKGKEMVRSAYIFTNDSVFKPSFETVKFD